MPPPKEIGTNIFFLNLLITSKKKLKSVLLGLFLTCIILTLFTYYCQVCHKPHVGYFKGEKTNCPFCGDKSAVFPNVVKGLTDAQLNKIYNLMNVYVQYAICEGLGIPQLEAASAGIPLISVDYSAMSEVSTYLNADKVSYALFKEM